VTAWQLWTSIPFSAGLAAILVVLLVRDPRRPLSPTHLPSRLGSRPEQLGLGFVLLAFAWGTDRVVSRRFQGVLPGGPTPWTGVVWTQGAILAYVVGTLFGAIYEEVLFRAYLITRIGSLVGVWPAVLLSAVCFAAVHGYPPRQTVGLLVFGVVFGFAWVRTRSLLALTTAHWCYNLFVRLLGQ
jgi:membrane protease YdiL (CAAX protease family)